MQISHKHLQGVLEGHAGRPRRPASGRSTLRPCTYLTLLAQRSVASQRYARGWFTTVRTRMVADRSGRSGKWRRAGRLGYRVNGIPEARPPPGEGSEMLPDLLAAIELDRDAGGLAQLPWPGRLADTIEVGGQGCCLHATMRRARRQSLARYRSAQRPRRQDSPWTTELATPRATPGNHAREHRPARFAGPCEHWPATQ